MAGHDIIVVGASAGGVEALSTLVADLPEDLPAAVFLVLHMGPHSATALPRILSRRAKLPVDHPTDGDPIEPGRIYVARPDHHLLLIGDAVRVVNGPRENGLRPSVDTLFRSAAAAYGPRVVGVVLSGSRDDGTAGLQAIHRGGGITVVQDPQEARFPGMPQSALSRDHPHYVLPVGEIGEVLVKLAHEEPADEGRLATMSDEINAELQWSNPELAWSAPADPPIGNPSGFTCPECHGGLWQIDEDRLPRFRCRIGHGFSIESLLAVHESDVENALWIAYRALEERVALLRRLAERAAARHADITAEHFGNEAADVGRQAEVLRALLWSKTEDERESGVAEA